MKIGIREKIIRRLGGVPLWRVGRDPLPGWFMVVESSTIQQRVDGVWVEVMYRVIDRERIRQVGKK